MPSLGATTSQTDSCAPRLIWCHELSQSEENQDRRQMIKDFTTERSWSLSFLKKATQFSKWLTEGSQEEYTLVLGWRETQPCFRFLAELSGKPPSMSVVVCANKRQHTRATKYVSSLASSFGPVHVCLYEEIPSDLLDGHIRQCFGPLDGEVSSSGCQEMEREESLASTHSSFDGTRAPSSSCEVATLASCDLDSFALSTFATHVKGQRQPLVPPPGLEAFGPSKPKAVSNTVPFFAMNTQVARAIAADSEKRWIVSCRVLL
mmetsp:Transcript_6409/g.14020  ORF Transcript_6409/g.14020 Transcript_6409/m.14020 type:complete len:262 (+) Transcript_6409:85-870(+)